jgi:SAM-dependent methyltransferase/predicted Ser/Thr protein kinase
LTTAGETTPDLPRRVADLLGIGEATYRNGRHWVGIASDSVYKITPHGSPGQRKIRLEAEILAKLQHPNIARGELKAVENWDVLRIDKIEGETLTGVRSRLTKVEKLSLLDSLEETIRYVNSQGILHADVSSENVLWDGERAYLIDFEEAKQIVPGGGLEDSPDIIGGPPCCWGDIGYGYETYLCLNSLRAWLLMDEFLDLNQRIREVGEWTPASPGNTCMPETTPDDGSTYQRIRFGNELTPGQRDPVLRVRYLSASKRIRLGGQSVLDVGCNFGVLSSLLESLGARRYVGLDVNPNYIEIATELANLDGRKRSAFLAGDICDGSTAASLRELAPDGFDVVICQSVYHHIEDKERFWSIISDLHPRWVVLEGPVDLPSCLLKGTWEDEKQFLQTLGYGVTFESSDNDYPGRVLALFDRVRAHPAGSVSHGSELAQPEGPGSDE